MGEFEREFKMEEWRERKKVIKAVLYVLLSCAVSVGLGFLMIKGLDFLIMHDIQDTIGNMKYSILFLFLGIIAVLIYLFIPIVDTWLFSGTVFLLTYMVSENILASVLICLGVVTALFSHFVSWYLFDSSFGNLVYALIMILAVLHLLTNFDSLDTDKILIISAAVFIGTLILYYTLIRYLRQAKLQCGLIFSNIVYSFLAPDYADSSETDLKYNIEILGKVLNVLSKILYAAAIILNLPAVIRAVSDSWAQYLPLAAKIILGYIIIKLLWNKLAPGLSALSKL